MYSFLASWCIVHSPVIFHSNQKQKSRSSGHSLKFPKRRSTLARVVGELEESFAWVVKAATRFSLFIDTAEVDNNATTITVIKLDICIVLYNQAGSVNRSETGTRSSSETAVCTSGTWPRAAHVMGSRRASPTHFWLVSNAVFEVTFNSRPVLAVVVGIKWYRPPFGYAIKSPMHSGKFNRIVCTSKLLFRVVGVRTPLFWIARVQSFCALGLSSLNG